MIIYCKPDGTLIKYLYDSDRYKDVPPLEEHFIVEVDEIPDNLVGLVELIQTFHMEDANGLGKYYYENGEFIERQGWIPT